MKRYLNLEQYFPLCWRPLAQHTQFHNGQLPFWRCFLPVSYQSSQDFHGFCAFVFIFGSSTGDLPNYWSHNNLSWQHKRGLAGVYSKTPASSAKTQEVQEQHFINASSHTAAVILERALPLMEEMTPLSPWLFTTCTYFTRGTAPRLQLSLKVNVPVNHQLPKPATPST